MQKNKICDLPWEIIESFLESTSKGNFIVIKIKPGSKLEKLTLSGINELSLGVKSQAFDNQANLRACEILSQIFKVPKSHVKIMSGHKSRIKRFQILGNLNKNE